MNERDSAALRNKVRSSATLRGLNAGAFADHPTGDTGQAAKLERSVGDAALGALQVQGKIDGRLLVRITSIRKRLLDEDNLCEKYHVDLLRYSGILPSDAPGATKIEVAQEKVEAGGREEVRIEIFRIK